MQLLTVILSSVVISSIVSLILGYILDDRKYLKNKKIQVYSEFLEQLNKTIPVGEEIDTINPAAIIEKVRKEAHNLTSYSWKVRLITKNDNIQEQVEYVLRTLDEFIQLASDVHLKRIEIAEAAKKALNILQKRDIQKEYLITEMNKDIRRF
ncbi:hypothetical protein KW782_00310 [Candidatus Parcubacteria bacterium]|nr:hypothetical protein [Candidatus Parcubacteria bacterium]